MYLKKTPRKNKNGEIVDYNLAICESVYDPATRISRNHVVKGLGPLSKLSSQYEDPIAHFEALAAHMTEERNAARNSSITIDLTEQLPLTENNLKNVGYAVLKQIYKDLKLDVFWNWKSRGQKYEFSPDQIFRLLVFSRILFPESKKDTYDNRAQFFESFGDFSLQDVYRSLDVFCKHKEALQKWIYENSHHIVPRDVTSAYFDCTNYYFDIGHSDIDTLDINGNPVDEQGNPTAAKYRKRGPEKNHRPDPIVEMGLLMDRNGIPIAYDLFPGNESEKIHMRPIVNRFKEQFTDSRVIFVADRGLNTSDNIYFLNGDNKSENNRRDGYVYGQSVRGASDEFKKWVLSDGYQTDMVTADDGSKVKFVHKSRIYPKKIQVHVTKPDTKRKSHKSVTIDQKQMAYYSEKYARKQKIERDIMIQRAKDLIAHPRKYDKVTSAGSAAYIQNIAFDKTTGAVVDGLVLSLDLDKIHDEEQYDGYYSIVSSELKLSDLELRDIYRGLIRIEDTFKISKSEFSSRPVFLWTNDHIDGHFAACFVSLVIIRLLQAKLGNNYPVGKILDALRSYSCVKLDDKLYQFVFNNEIMQACGKEFGIDFSKKYRSQNEIRRMLRY